MSTVRLSEMIKDMPPDEARIIIKKFYDGAYEHGLYDPPNGRKLFESILGAGVSFIRCLDVGCGNGEGVKYATYKGLNAYGIDIADASNLWKKNGVNDRCKIAPANKIPYHDNSFDLVVCGDVLEHVPEWDIDDTLKEIYRVGSRVFVFAVALGEENERVGGIVVTHITIHDSDWWMERFARAGFVNGIKTVDGQGHHLMCFLRKGKQ